LSEVHLYAIEGASARDPARLPPRGLPPLPRHALQRPRLALSSYRSSAKSR